MFKLTVLKWFKSLNKYLTLIKLNLKKPYETKVKEKYLVEQVQVYEGKQIFSKNILHILSNKYVLSKKSIIGNGHQHYYDLRNNLYFLK